jgi:hypothetical protein
MKSWPDDQQKYTMIYREGTEGFKPTGCAADGWITHLLTQTWRDFNQKKEVDITPVLL